MSDPLLDELPILRELGAALAEGFQAAEARAGAGRRRQPRWRRRAGRRRQPRWLFGAGLLAATAAAAVAFVLALQGGSAAPQSATAALIEAADAAAAHPLPFPRDDQFYYVRSLDTSSVPVRRGLIPAGAPVGPRASVTTEERLWFSADRTGRIALRLVSVRFPSEAARRLWVSLGRPSFVPAGPAGIAPLGSGRYLIGNLELTRSQVFSLPSDPRALYARLSAAGGGSAREVFVEIGDALRNRPAPAKLRAALYRALALVPGIRLAGRVTDGVGRAGFAVGFVQDGVEDELIFDPATATMLEERSIAHGAVVSRTTYLARAVTDTPR